MDRVDLAGVAELADAADEHVGKRRALGRGADHRDRLRLEQRPEALDYAIARLARERREERGREGPSFVSSSVVSPLSCGISTKRASTATAPSSETIRGLISASAMSSACVISRPPSPPTLSSASTIASRDDGLAPARAAEQRRALQLVEHFLRIEAGDRADAERHVGQHFDENAAQPHHHQRPELRVAQAADHDLLPGRRHLLEQEAVDARTLDRRQRHHRADGVLDLAARCSGRSVTPPASLLCRMSGEITLSASGGLSLPQAARRFVRILNDQRLRHGDAEARQQPLAGEFVERGAPLLPRFGNHFV